MEKLGGYYGRGVPTPFFLEYTGIQYGFVTQLHEIDENDTIIETKINIYLPKWLKECIYINQYVSGICENEHNTIYIARCNYYIDSNNAYFYTKEGKLYNKSDDTLVDKLIYQDNIEN